MALAVERTIRRTGVDVEAIGLPMIRESVARVATDAVMALAKMLSDTTVETVFAVLAMSLPVLRATVAVVAAAEAMGPPSERLSVAAVDDVDAMAFAADLTRLTVVAVAVVT